MRVLDAHQHFWKYDPQVHGWINEEMQAIRRDFLPGDLLPILQENGVAGCIAVQADETEKETEFLLELAAQNDFIKGVVGWVDLCAANVSERLTHYRQLPVLRGFRSVLQAKDPSYMLQPGFIRGMAALQEQGFTYDLLVFPKHLTAVLHLLYQFPYQSFVIDHIAKPAIRKPPSAEWTKDIRSISQHQNVYCKLSGLVTEADWENWRREDIFPYLDIITEAFGTQRLMFGSDWPVCLVAADYGRVIDLVRSYYAGFSPDEQDRIFYRNAVDFYHI